MKPEKRISTEQDLEIFLSSSIFKSLWNFMETLNQAVHSVPISAADDLADTSDAVKALVKVLILLSQWVDDIPPLQQPVRFGNKAFRVWLDKLRQEAPALIEQVLGKDFQGFAEEVDQNDQREQQDEQDKQDATAAGNQGGLELTRAQVVEELATYFADCFGNYTRIDYGSGHEAGFLILLYCMTKIKVFSLSDHRALVLTVFPHYLKVTRKLQSVYFLEPAGSHGVWGLDDYSFLPFLWGSSQLLEQTKLKPAAVLDDNVVREVAQDYLYFDAIKFIKETKSGPFFEHSPMLYDLTAVNGGWQKINQGMLKMYRAEVWGKRVVVQHLLFGSLFPYPQVA